MSKMRGSYAALSAAVVIGALLSLPQTGWAMDPGSAAGAAAVDDSSTAARAAAALNKKQLREVKVTVENGVATLTGNVNLFAYKADAEKRVRQTPGVRAVRDEIEVAGPNVPDDILQSKLLNKLAVDREGYDITFNAIGVKVNDGVVTLMGHARNYTDSNSAVALVSNYPGVKGVVNQIAVDPVSPVDDAIRLRTAQAIYGYPALNRYAMDPAKPIRISVQMGHVELYGTVDSQADKETAYLRASSVPGVFSVQNYLEVAGQGGEQPR